MNNLKEIRTNKEVSLGDLSRLTGLTPSYINNLENGYRVNPTKDTMDKIANALETSVPEIFYSNHSEGDK